MENKINEDIIRYSHKINLAIQEVGKRVFGQEKMIRLIFISLLSKGHILLEGVPGLAKTYTVETISKTIDLGFKRIQFTPDLLPSDLIGTEIFNIKTQEFNKIKGPIFSNLVLIDEINRAPSKVQSALLESMAEKQVTIGGETFKLPNFFMILATQNPLEQQGTYELPEAQLDRFLFKINVDYPYKIDELNMYKQVTDKNKYNIPIDKILCESDLENIQNIINDVYVDDKIFTFVLNLIDATRNPQNYSREDLKKYIKFGVSPRGGISLINSSKTVAFLNKRNFVIPEDILEISKEVLSHRITLSFEAFAEGVTSDKLIEEIISSIKLI